ncbi:hypothetical protein DFH11DRAFT_1549632 [Phellopilus nigrolimitatus]|nr:hypothetical protein DFH11DRAFT_1549632 [Phellopilus nigrolimitatus]
MSSFLDLNETSPNAGPPSLRPMPPKDKPKQIISDKSIKLAGSKGFRVTTDSEDKENLVWRLHFTPINTDDKLVRKTFYKVALNEIDEFVEEFCEQYHDAVMIPGRARTLPRVP